MVSGLLALSSCGTPQPTTQDTTIQGNVFASASAGGAPVQGARVTANLGDSTQSVITGPDGRFSLKLNTARTAQAFTITVEPPARSNLYASTYDNVPLEAYRSQYGAANELSIYLGTTRPSAALPGAAPRRGCLTGLLKDLGGQPVVSNALAVVSVSGGKPVPRPLYDNCATELTAIPNLAAGFATLPQPGETGLVIYGGSRVVRTDAQGKYLMPIQTTQNLHAVSGAMWAGNYDGGEESETSASVFWSKFQYIPEVPVFTSGATDTRDITLEAFDPATNPRVTTQPIRYDAGAIDKANNAVFDVYTSPSFEPAITSGTFPLGEYYTVDPAGGHNLRVPKLGQDNRAQNVTVETSLYRYSADGENVTGTSSFTAWRDGTNLGGALTANFIGIPAPQAPAQAEEKTPRMPTLSWNSVPNAKTYVVGVYRVTDTGATPVWVGYTTNTSLKVPLTLEANAEYLWQVSTDDSTEMLDYIGKDPLSAEAARWKSAGGLAKGRHLESALNTWRGEVAAGVLQATGQLPQFLGGPAAAYQRLQETGYRSSDSQEFTFTTGN
ncbi:hypothetical protein DAETH_26530 [Deinococcus aetherius]|uniref:Carboxypeptidase regulatory-like domain-containing protein n=1 Tax=Deinococcus aetherius TaxID=200252 RepID=A0ABM8AFU5_9DEIO|nr:hypothetical protein [Deinococcus aetherius]BDP42684.1 hypothetical protein DAETH_26530 [Deinococcus aetherius]